LAIFLAAIVLTLFVDLPFGNIKKLLIKSKGPVKIVTKSELNNNDINNHVEKKID
jgi:hypothetical protein